MRFKEHSMTGIIFDTKTKKDVGCYEVRPLLNELDEEIVELRSLLKSLGFDQATNKCKYCGSEDGVIYNRFCMGIYCYGGYEFLFN